MLIDNVLSTMETSLNSAMASGGNYTDNYIQNTVLRDFKATDLSRTLGVVSGIPRFNPEHFEMGQVLLSVLEYNIQIRVLIKNTDSNQARTERDTLLHRIIREMHRDPGTYGDLKVLSETLDGVTQRFYHLKPTRTDDTFGKEENSPVWYYIAYAEYQVAVEYEVI